MTTVQVVFDDSFGLLEHILSYAAVRDLVVATEVNRRWKEAGRSNVLWEALYKTRVLEGTLDPSEKIKSNAEIPLFWRSCLSDTVIDQLTVRQIRRMFDHYLLQDKKAQLENCLEKMEMKQLLRTYRDEEVLGDDDFDDYDYPEDPTDEDDDYILTAPTRGMIKFPSLWFGCFSSAALDARRSVMLRLELCNPHGFDVNFKILSEEVWEEADMTDLEPYEGHPGVLLYPHSICHFTADGSFVMDLQHPTQLTWRQDDRSRVQVGPYPHLEITREANGRWKMENVHVVLYYRSFTAAT